MESTDRSGRRRGDATLLEAINQLQRTLEERVPDGSAQLDAVENKIDKILRGFPGQDPESHCRYHESIIEWRELRNKMVREALIHAGKVGGWAAIGWIIYALWTAFKMEITK